MALLHCEGSETLARTHVLEADPKTVHWGYFDPTLSPVLEIESGDTVTIHTVSGGKAVTPGGDFGVPPELRRIHEEVTDRREPGHILTGPIAIRGATPGDVIEIHIREVKLKQDWGWNVIRPLMGALPDDFPEYRLVHLPLDMKRNVAKLPWGVELPLSPFFGVMGVAPPKPWGRISSIEPRAHGGNIDCKELGPGATLYLPVFNSGGLFSTGDGHAAQGDGEVCVTAIETALIGTFEFVLRRDLRLRRPRAETATHFITFGMHGDLDDAAKRATRDMIGLIRERSNLAPESAYMLCSIAADLRVTQIVNGEKGCHMMLPKAALHG